MTRKCSVRGLPARGGPKPAGSPGTYRGEYIVRRGGKTIIEITREIELR